MLTCTNCRCENPDGAKFCNECAAPLGVHDARAERKIVTALFCDLVGSTSLGEQHDPEVLRPLLGRYFAEMRAAVERHGGRVEKFIGDAVAAVFGLPAAHEDDALRAVRAGVEMHERLRTLNDGSQLPLAARVGITTGEVLTPGDGTPLIGDVMNTAARLQSGAAPGEVWIGEPTWSLVRDAVVAEAVEPVEAKGKAEAVPAFRVTRVASLSPMRTRRMDAPMLGRERESALLANAYERVATDRACQLFTVLGVAGAGKSRLVEEFLSGLDDAEVLRGRCLPYGEGITYYPVTEAMKQALGLADFDDASSVHAAIAEAVGTEEHAEAITANLAKLLAAGEGGAPEETPWAIRRFFETRGTGRPVVVVFDDIHWGEAALLDLIEHIAEWSRNASILLVCMARPDLLDVRPTWAGGKTNAISISLAPLTEAQSSELIADLLGASLPEAAATRIIRAAEGNPLFVEEMLRMLVDEGLLVRDGDVWMPAGDLEQVQVPPTISALLSARLDRLSAEERTVLERAAVIGKVFHRGAVLQLLDEPARPDLDVHLRSLVRKELIGPERSTLPGQDAYRFRHLLTRDAAYDAVPKSDRAELHEGVADWLVGIAGEGIAEQEEIVAHHLEQAASYRAELGLQDERTREVAVRASAHLASVGRRASRRGDHVAAAKLLRRALAMGTHDDAEGAQLLYDLADGVEWAGDYPGAVDAWTEAAAAAERIGDLRNLVLARVRRSMALTFADPLAAPGEEVVRAELTTAVAQLEAIGDDAGLAIVWSLLAYAEWGPCRFDAAARAGRRALEYARRSGDERAMANALIFLLGAEFVGSTAPDDCLRSLDELAGDVAGNRVLTSVADVFRGGCRGMQGAVDDARDLITRAEEDLANLGQPIWVATATLALGDLETWAGDPSAAEGAFRPMYEMLREAGDEAHASSAAAELARVLFDLGRLDEADRYAGVAVATSAVDDVLSQAAGRSVRALVLAARGRAAEAEKLARDAVERYLAAGAEAPVTVGNAWIDLARVLRMGGETAKALDAAREALALYERKRHRPLIASARALIDELDG